MRQASAEITVTSARRYGCVTGRRWPVDVAPAPGELLSSWLHRLAFANGVPPRYFGRFLGAVGENWSVRLDRMLPDRIFRLLAEHTRVPLEDIADLAAAPDPLARLRLPLRSGRREICASGSRANWLQFCPACLREDDAPYFRRRWTLATRVSCLRHGCRLRDECPTCGGGLVPFRQDRLVPQQICAWCGADLRKPTAPADPGIRRFERLIDDLLCLHAAGSQPRGKPSLPALLGAACFTSGAQRRSVMRLSHRDRYRLFLQLTEGSLPVGQPMGPAMALWARIAGIAPTYRGLTASFTKAVLSRNTPGGVTRSTSPDLAELLRTATRLHANRSAP